MEPNILIEKADKRHVSGIARVCTDGNWAAYENLHSKEYIQRVVEEYYNFDRISEEVSVSNKHWGGYFVALENEKVVGAGGGGMTGENVGELFVLYVDPERRNEGIGSQILEAVTEQQKEFGAKEQWVSVAKGNQKGIPFYKAKEFAFKHERLSHGNTEDEDYMSLRLHRVI